MVGAYCLRPHFAHPKWFFYKLSILRRTAVDGRLQWNRKILRMTLKNRKRACQYAAHELKGGRWLHVPQNRADHTKDCRS